MANPAKKQARVFSATEAPAGATATSTADLVAMLSDLQQRIQENPEKVAEEAKKVDAEQVTKDILSFRAGLTEPTRKQMSSVLHGTGHYDLAVLMETGKLPDPGLWNSCKRLGAVNINVNKGLLIGGGLLAAALIYNYMVAPKMKFPTLGELLGN